MLFTLMTHDCVPKSATNHIVKFADNTTVVRLIRDNNDQAYREEVEQLVKWCSENNLILNVTQTKEIIVDFTAMLLFLSTWLWRWLEVPGFWGCTSQTTSPGLWTLGPWSRGHNNDCTSAPAEESPYATATVLTHHRKHPHQLHLGVGRTRHCLGLEACEKSGKDCREDHWDLPPVCVGHCLKAVSVPS